MRAILRFNMVMPQLERSENGKRHQAMLEMCRYADANGIDGISLEEHHGAFNGWSSSPLILAALIFGASTNLQITLSALLVPLHDPIRIAEDIAALDLASGGRLITIAGIGYRPEEYALHGKDWANRGTLMDECIATMLKAWTGEPFEYNGTTVQVTPAPASSPHPMLFLGGTSKIAARRAARFGLPMFAAAAVPGLQEYYLEQCQANGTHGFYIAPSQETAMIHIAEDPDRAWAELGHHFLHEATTYAGWQTPDIHSAVHSHATTVEELRADGTYRVLTPDEAIERCKAMGPFDALTMHPLCGGLPIDEAWSSIHLAVEKVIPAVGSCRDHERDDADR
jgi:alkanesulfonate monooxygenase SsuD/methylene tetrahydromethanopterin reductase-like flavin-dependent oxidoreductase (luciferase family)